MGKLHPSLLEFSQFISSVKPADFLTGDIDKREGEIILEGKKSDNLESVRRRVLNSINRWFWENPRDADDTRLVYEAEETGSKYEEKKGGKAQLTLKIKVELATHSPDVCC